jgi:two-component system chemotaxis response regulator CheY
MALRVLLVDDSPVIHSLLQRVLERNNYEICGHAMNGKEGLEMFQSLCPDLIFMDISMPVMNGIEATENIKKLNPDAKIIMLSAMGDDEIIAEAKEKGIDVFLKKPFDDYKIISAIASIV